MGCEGTDVQKDCSDNVLWCVKLLMFWRTVVTLFYDVWNSDVLKDCSALLLGMKFLIFWRTVMTLFYEVWGSWCSEGLWWQCFMRCEVTDVLKDCSDTVLWCVKFLMFWRTVVTLIGCEVPDILKDCSDTVLLGMKFLTFWRSIVTLFYEVWNSWCSEKL
jgi:hypothetical protein